MSKTIHLLCGHIKRSHAKTIVRFALLAVVALPACATTRVTVDQLEQEITAHRGLSDKEAAERLTALELTERLSQQRYERLRSELPGDRARLALQALADSSAFSDLPPADRLHLPAPTIADQGHMISKAADFVVAAVSRMPDFFAAQTTSRFQDLNVTGSLEAPVVVAHQGFRFIDKASAVVTFKNGREVLEPAVGKKPGSSAMMSSTGLTTWGVFGPLLGLVMTDIMKGKIGWGHWEQGPSFPLAVFRYMIPEDEAHYTVRYCCFRAERGEMKQFEAVPAYHGEIAIDPKTGAVLRLVLKMDMQHGLPMERADQAVDYGPVEIGGRTCICPVHSISVSRAQTLTFHGYQLYDDTGGRPDPGGRVKTVEVPMATAINDVIFADYHQFRGEVRILPTTSVDPAVPTRASPNPPGPNPPSAAAPPAASPQP
jgi:hypothetical protein